jgi:hypothetical protein
VDISCYLTGGGWRPSLSEQVITDERLCTTQTYEQKGRSQRGLEVEYIDNTNSPEATTYNKAKDTLVPGTEHFLVVRTGLPYTTALAAGQKVTVYPVTAGEYNDMPQRRYRRLASLLETPVRPCVVGPRANRSSPTRPAHFSLE